MTVSHKVDARGLSCPAPLQTLIMEIRRVEPGASLELFSTDPAVEKDVRAWLSKAGHHLEEVEEKEGVYRLRIRRKVPFT